MRHFYLKTFNFTCNTFFNIILRLLQDFNVNMRTSCENLNSMHARTHAVHPTHVMLAIRRRGQYAACQHLSLTHEPTHLTIRENDQTEKKTKERSEKRNRQGEIANIGQCVSLYLFLSHLAFDNCYGCFGLLADF